MYLKYLPSRNFDMSQKKWKDLPYEREMTTLLNMSPFLNKSPSKNEVVKYTTLMNGSSPNLRLHEFF